MSLLQSLLRAGSRLYKRVVRRRLDPRTREIADALRAVPALSDLSSRAVYAMAGVAHRRTYQRGEVLYCEGDPGLGLYVVESGRVRLIADGSPDGNIELGEIGKHEMVGGLSLLGDFERLETAETLVETSVLGFFRPDLKNVMRRDPKAGGEIAIALARDLGAHHVGLLQRIEELQDREMALKAYAEAAKFEAVDNPQG